MVLIWESDIGDRAGGYTGIDEDVGVALDEGAPFKVERDTLCVANKIPVELLRMILLCRDHLQKLPKPFLNPSNDISLEFGKGILNCKQIFAVIVLLDDLLVQAVEHASLKDIRVMNGIDSASA